MFTVTNSYTKKISSGTVLSLLLISGLLVAVPAILPAVAAQNSSMPTLTVSPTLVVTAINTATSITIKNPVSNANPITSFTLFAPTGWTFDTTATCGTYLNTPDAPSEVTASVTECTGTLDPGFSDTINIGGVTGPASPATAAPPAGVFTTNVQDSGSAGEYPGPSVTMWSIAATTVAVTPAAAHNFVAGSAPVTITATLSSGQPGVPVGFSFTNGAYPSAGYTASLSPTSGVTNSLGVLTTTFTPSNSQVDATSITAALGTSPAIMGASGVYTTLAATPTILSFQLSGLAFPSTHYVRSFGPAPNCGVHCTNEAKIGASNVGLVVSDPFGNANLLNNAFFSAISAQVVTTSAGGIFKNGGANQTKVTTADCVDVTSNLVTCEYFQSGTWGSAGVLTSAVSGKWRGTSFSISANSGNIVTSTFDTAANIPTCPDCTPSTLAAGKAEAVTYTLTTPQLNVPVWFLAVNTTSPYVGSWVGGTNPYDFLGGNYNITGSTSGNGYHLAKAVESFNIDTTAPNPFAVPPTPGSAVTFEAIVAAPTDGNPSKVLGPSAPTATVTTTFAAPSSFIVYTYFDKLLTEPTTNAFSAATLYVDVILVDQFGNPSTNPSAAQIQIALHASAGTLSAATIYVASNTFDTATPPSFGPVTWTTAGTAPTTITLTASGNIPGASSGSSNTETLSIVTHTPSFSAAATSGNTYSGVVYSKASAVTFGGKAGVSLGWDPALGVNFHSTGGGIYYKIDNGAWALATVGGPHVSWTFTAIFTSGTHTITFNATDSQGDMSAPVTIQLLIDGSAPTITAVTTTGSVLNAGSAVSFSITDTEGDLNASSVVATTNSTATLTATVTGTNNNGHSVTYTVSVAGLPASTGHWSVTLNAKDLAKNAAAAKTITVKVTVAFAVSFVVQGTPSKGTCGGYTCISAAYQNLNPTSQTVIVFAVWKLGTQTVGISTSSATVASGATYSAPLVEPPGVPSGTYTVNIFVWTTGNLPVSSTTSITVSV